MKTIGLLLAFALAVSASIIPEQHTGIQSYKVRGKLLCGASPAANVRVKLVDDDFGPYVPSYILPGNSLFRDPDDDLDSGYTDMVNFLFNCKVILNIFRAATLNLPEIQLR